MSDPFRDDQDAQLLRAEALALENERLRRERDDLQAKLDDRVSVPAPQKSVKVKTQITFHANTACLSTYVIDAALPRRFKVESRGPYKDLTLAGPDIKIGRVPSAHLRITEERADPSVARMHAIIEAFSAAACTVIDLGSVYGTYVNGTRVNKAPLRSGDLLQIGDVALRVDIVEIPLEGPP